MTAIIQKIKSITAEEFGVTVEQMEGLARNQMPTIARQAAMFLIMDHCGLNECTVGQLFNRHHGTVYNAKKQTQNALDVNKGFRATIKIITERINHE